MEVDGEACILDIMDTAGQEEYSALRDQYMKTGEGFVLVYSVTSMASFEATTKLRTDILRTNEDKPEIPIILVGNKIDVESERVVSRETGAALAAKFNCAFKEASAKTNTNVNEIFFDLVRLIKAWRPNHPHQTSSTERGKKEKCLLL